jgi:CDP-diacylglycerol--serine O-phosphatidyltransferase
LNVCCPALSESGSPGVGIVENKNSKVKEIFSLRVKANLVPGFFTMANMFCGYYSAILSSQERFITAVWLIVAAGILDVLDGKLARLTQSSSDFGVQYDSMADVISFGLASSMLSYYAFFQTWGTIGLLLSFIPLVFGSIRLARFNIRADNSDKKYFEGLPIPAAAIAIAAFVLFNFEIWESLRWPKILLALVLLVSFLMVTSIRFESMPNFSLQSNRANRFKILMVILGIVIILISPHKTFFPILVLYVLSGPLRVVWLIVKSDNGEDEQEIKERKK